MTVSREGDTIRERAIRLFAFLREMTLLRSKVVRSVDEYDRAIWLAEIPREPGCYCAAWGMRRDGDEHSTWIEVRKPKLTAPPDPPADLAPWLDLSQVTDSAREYPDLREAIAVPDESNPDAAPVIANLAEHPETKSLWESYVENDWWPWAEGDRRMQRVQSIYTDLFSMYQKQQRLAELYEVVIGLGLLTWKMADGRAIMRHIVTGQATLEFDTKRGILTVGVGAEGAKLRLEQDMLEPQELPSAEHQNAFQDELLKAGDDVWVDDRVKAVIQGWITALLPTSRFADGLERPPKPDSIPQIHFAPALILRRRTDRSLIQVFDSIRQALETGGPLPEGVRRLVDIVEDDMGATFGDGRDSAHDEIYFPLPANDEQLRIARRISTRSGVVVQGPPGTGKSHTIANLICHLLASDKRVLVTSQTPRALKVLRGKIPDHIKPLCVSLLGDDQEAMASLDESVRGIIDRQVVWDHDKSDQRVQQLKRELDLARRDEAETLSRLRAKREQETHVQHLPGGYDGTATKIAQSVQSSAASNQWFGERPTANDEPPLLDSEAIELLLLLRTIDEQKQRESARSLIPPERILAPSVFAAQVQKESACRSAHTAMEQHRRHAAYELLKSTNRQQRADLRTAIRELGTESSVLEKQPDPWVPKAVKDMLGGKHHLLG